MDAWMHRRMHRWMDGKQMTGYINLRLVMPGCMHKRTQTVVHPFYPARSATMEPSAATTAHLVTPRLCRQEANLGEDVI